MRSLADFGAVGWSLQDTAKSQKLTWDEATGWCEAEAEIPAIALANVELLMERMVLLVHAGFAPLRVGVCQPRAKWTGESV